MLNVILLQFIKNRFHQEAAKTFPLARFHCGKFSDLPAVLAGGKYGQTANDFGLKFHSLMLSQMVAGHPYKITALLRP